MESDQIFSVVSKLYISKLAYLYLVTHEFCHGTGLEDVAYM